jgi:hypothetical protein
VQSYGVCGWFLKQSPIAAENRLHEAWLMSEVNRLRAVVAELIAETLTLKKVVLA